MTLNTSNSYMLSSRHRLLVRWVKGGVAMQLMITPCPSPFQGHISYKAHPSYSDTKEVSAESQHQQQKKVQEQKRAAPEPAPQQLQKQQQQQDLRLEDAMKEDIAARGGRATRKAEKEKQEQRPGHKLLSLYLEVESVYVVLLACAFLVYPRLVVWLAALYATYIEHSKD